MSFFTLFQTLSKPLHGRNLGRIPGARRLYDFLYRSLRPRELTQVQAEGFRFWIDPNDTGLAPALLMRGAYEPFETEIYKELIKPGMTVLDIGANVGYFSLIFSRCVGPKGKVHSFEPEPKTFSILKRNIEENAIDNTTLNQIAVSAESGGTVLLYLDKNNLGNMSLSNGNIAPADLAGGVAVRTTTLDDYCGSMRVDFIKMDVQGAEALVIKGAEHVLRSNKLKMVLEFWPFGIRNCHADPLALVNQLQKWGFTLRVIDVNLKIVRVANAEALLKIEHQHVGWANIVCEN